MIFPQTCPHCGSVSEPLLIQVAQVVNVCCYECQQHIRYCTINDLPPLDDIKLAAYQVAECDLQIIDIAKKSLQFTPSNYNDFAQVKYWRLYVSIPFVKFVCKSFDRITKRITFVANKENEYEQD